MANSYGRATRISVRVAHWTGVLLGTALTLLAGVFMIGEGPPPLSAQTASLALMLIGFVWAWRSDLVGGSLSLLGIIGFYALNFAAAGNFPGGWVFPLCFVPGALCVSAWLLRRIA